jgi:hypothetical protein
MGEEEWHCHLPRPPHPTSQLIVFKCLKDDVSILFSSSVFCGTKEHDNYDRLIRTTLLKLFTRRQKIDDSTALRQANLFFRLNNPVDHCE